jgi:hypothetical protein
MLRVGERLFVLETERGELVQVERDGRARAVLAGLGIPILIRKRGSDLVIFANRHDGVPSLLTVRP